MSESAVSSRTTPQFDCGDGSDGALAFDGIHKVIELTPSGNEYTLTRDVFATTIFVNEGVTIKTAGFRIRAQVSVTGAGVIADNGTAASGVSAGAALSEAGTLARSSGAGGAGEVTTSKAGGNVTNALGGKGGLGGEGKSGNTGGAGGTATATEAKLGSPHGLGFADSGYLSSAAGLQKPTGGGGGGGGTGEGTKKGGGGGGGGGVVFIATPKISGTLKIEAVGGAGGKAEAAATEGAGGAGGGGGALILTVSESITSTVVLSVAGGAGGAAVGTATKAPEAGAAGTIYRFGPSVG
jgi:hypothetical protein